MESVGKMDTTNMDNVIKELNTWCMNYRGFINQVFSEQVTMEEKVTKLFWCVKKVCESQVEVMEQYNALYDYVMNYFSGLDIQKEIKDALQELINDGTIGNIINDELLGELNTKVNKNASDITDLKNGVENMNNFRDNLKRGGNRILFMGDSIAAGFGWWTNGDTSADRGGKEGIMQMWKDAYPNNTYVNVAQNGCCLGSNGAGSSYPKIQDQIPTDTYDYIFIICGINDVLNFEKQGGVSNAVGDMPVLFEAMSALQWDSAYNALYSLMATFRQKYGTGNNIFYCISPTTDYNYFKYISFFKVCKKIVKFFGYHVLDMYDIFPRYNMPNVSGFFYDNIHPNVNGYRALSNHMLNMIGREVVQRNSDSFESDVYNIYSPNIKNLGTEGQTDFVTYKRFCLNAVPEIVKAFGDAYINKTVTLNAGNNNFIPVKLEHSYGEAWYVTFLPTKTFRFPCRFKYTSGITESEDDVFMSPSSNMASVYGVTRICDIPISGIFYGSISQYTDLPSKWTGTLLCTIIAHVNIQVAADQPTGYVGYKWIEVVPYGSTERFYCRWIKNNYNTDALIDYFTDTSLQPYNG